MGNYYKNKDILITGGAGSIGRAIAKTLLSYNPKKIRILDHDETAQFYLQQYLKNHKNVRYLIGDIRDKDRLKWAARGVNIIIHCAALKHVPSCEYNTSEAIETNLIGLNNVIRVANEQEVEKCIYISTDKAVVPYNVMGITKLLGEKLINNAAMGAIKTKFATVRFGNVLDSNGSVIPLFKKQIQNGGPVTITHPDMTRFFMTINNAVQLILRVIAKTKGQKTYILKMNALRIKDLAEVMIEELAKQEIETKIIGTRPGEKLYELLLAEEEKEIVTDTGNMFILNHQIVSPHMINKIKKHKKPINNYLYDSSKSKFLTKEEIKNVLKKERII